MTDNNKVSLRNNYLKIRRSIPRDEIVRVSNEIIGLLKSTEEYAKSDTLLLFASYPDEINTYPLAEAALTDGKRVAYPLCNAENHTMTFHYCKPAMLKPGYMNIPEPSADYPEYASEPALCIVPGILYDRRGNRLGFGGGYYDRFLPGFNGITAGLAMSDFVVEYGTFTPELFDIPCSMIVTEKEVIRTEKAK